MEIWKDVQGYEGRYQVSNLGRVKVKKKWNGSYRKYEECNKLMSPTDNGRGYLFVSLIKDRKRKNHYVHRLVAECFVENPENKKVVNHIDYNTRNNIASNLEWTSQAENVAYSAVNMKGKEHKGYSKTGEKGIYYRANKDYFRVIVNKKEIGHAKTIKEAIEMKKHALESGVM